MSIDQANTQASHHIPLPTVLTNLVGRQREIADIRHLLHTARLVNLVGAGGCGKTRLALAVSLAVEPIFADGVCWVDLTQVNDPAFIAQTVAKALRISEQQVMSFAQALQEKLATRQTLLVFDNCEHLLVACAELIEMLLHATKVQVLVTSRQPLKVIGEMLYPVPPLTLPTPGQTLSDIAQSEAIQLFVERAHSIHPSFALTAENADSMVAICHQLDGMPLAIELASARTNVLSVQQIQQRLTHPLDLLVATLRNDQRHRTLRAAIDWSYDLLSHHERLLLQRLSVFAAGFTLTTVEAICAWGELTRPQILDLLTSLVNKSLVVVEATQGREACYRLLETIRQHAGEKLSAADERVATFDHYLENFVKLAEDVAPKLTTQQQQLWMHWLESEHANLRVGLDWALESQQYVLGFRLACALYQFWDARGYVSEGFTWFERLHRQADATASEIPFALRVNALTFAAFLAMFLHELTLATAWAQQAVTLCEAAGEAGKPLLGFALAGRVAAARKAGDWQTARFLLACSIEVERASPHSNKRSLGMTLYVSGVLEIVLDQYVTAQHFLNEALHMAQQADDRYRMGLVFSALGDLARCEDRLGEAQTCYEQSLALFHEAGAKRDLPNLQRNFAYACLRQGDAWRAHSLLQQSLEEQQRRNHLIGILQGLLGFAALAATVGQAETSVCLHSFVVDTRKFDHQQTILSGLESGNKADAHDYQQATADLRTQVSDAAYQRAQSKGRLLLLEQAVTVAITLPLTTFHPAAVVHPSPHNLTLREQEVVALIGDGFSNGEIAAHLVLSKRTVEKHIAHILARLALTNRAQIVRWALDHELTSRAVRTDTPLSSGLS